MGDFFHEKADRDLFFSTFGNDIGLRLDRLKFEFDAIENGTIPEEPEIIIEDVTEGITLENKVQSELEKNIENDIRKEPKERTRSYTLSIQRAFSTVSLMTNFKSSFWKKRREKNPKKQDINGRERSASTSSTPEKNNNGLLKVSGESEGRATIYSTVPRQSKKVQRSKTMSPSTNKPIESQLSSALETLERDDSGNVFVPPVVVDGQLVYDYQYATPREGSPVPKSPKKDAKLKRRNSLSRLLNIRKSPRKSPKKGKNTTPIKQLYEKTVLSASKQEDLDKVGMNGHGTPEKKTSTTVTPEKETSKTVTPKKETSKTVTPEKETSKTVTPKKETSKTVTPRKETSKTVTPEKETSKSVTPEKITPEVEKNGEMSISITSEKTGNTVKPEKNKESEKKQIKKQNGSVKYNSSSAVRDTAI